MSRFNLSQQSDRCRGPISRGLAAAPAGREDLAGIDRMGGRYSAGLIRGVSLITRGEALGHDFWCDRRFVASVAEAVEAAGDRGVKARFTHPDMSSDGLAKFLGRVRYGDTIDDGDRAIGDLNFERSAHDTPDGDLAGYVLDRAEEDAESFGASIVFQHDVEAEEAFALEHGAEWVDDPDWGPRAVLQELPLAGRVERRSSAARPAEVAAGLRHRRRSGRQPGRPVFDRPDLPRGRRAVVLLARPDRRRSAAVAVRSQPGEGRRVCGQIPEAARPDRRANRPRQGARHGG